MSNQKRIAGRGKKTAAGNRRVAQPRIAIDDWMRAIESTIASLVASSDGGRPNELVDVLSGFAPPEVRARVADRLNRDASLRAIAMRVLEQVVAADPIPSYRMRRQLAHGTDVRADLTTSNVHVFRLRQYRLSYSVQRVRTRQGLQVAENLELQGLVLDNNVPLPAALIRLQDTALSAFTDHAGVFRLNPVAPGRQTIIALLPEVQLVTPVVQVT